MCRQGGYGLDGSSSIKARAMGISAFKGRIDVFLGVEFAICSLIQSNLGMWT